MARADAVVSDVDYDVRFLDMEAFEDPLSPTLECEISAPSEIDLVAAAPSRDFRMSGKRLYLTFPQCSTTPQTALDRIRTKWTGGVKWCVVSQEKHEDGAFHLHVALWLKKRYQTRRANCLDFVGGKHGNYQAMKDVVKCVTYVIKDGHYVAFGIDPRIYVAQRKKHVSVAFGTMAELVRAGVSLPDLSAQHPGFMLQHLSKVQAYAAFQEACVQPMVLDWPPDMTVAQTTLLNVPELLIYTWITTQVQGTPVRPFGTPQLMVIGPTGIGKTTLLMHLSKLLRIYWVPMGESFYDGYRDEAYDIIVFDEYRSQKTIQFMNSFVQGSPMTLRVKGGQVMKRKNLPVIVLSNYEPHQAYSNVQRDSPEVLKSYLRRFQVVRCNQGQDLYDLCSYFE